MSVQTINVQMTPGVSQASPTNGIGQVILNYAKHLPDFGIRLVGTAETHDLTAAHAGAALADVAHLHGLIWTAEQPASQNDHLMNARIVNAIRHAKAVTVPSEWVAECLRRDMHLDPYVIPHGVDVAEWEHTEEHDGYVLWNKNRNDVVCDPTPVSLLAALRPNTPFVSTFCLNPKSANIRITGLVPFPDMKRMIQRASVYLATTRETGRIGVLEAMASGVPVLGFKWGDTAGLIKHGETGYLVDPGDYMALAAGLDYVMTHWQRFSDGAHEAAKAWTWRRAAESVAEVYRKAMRNDPPIVRVVIPCHNKSAFIEEALMSVEQQTYSDVQLTVVDDASTDNSPEVIRRWISYSPRFKDRDFNNGTPKTLFAEMEINRGVALARNAGAFFFSGVSAPKYLVFLDADDLIAPAFVETCVRAMESDPTLGVAYTALRFIHSAQAGGWPREYHYDWQLAGRNQVPTCCMIRYEAFKRAGGYDPMYCPTGAGVEDAELWLRLGALGWDGKQVTGEPLFIYRPGGSTQQPGYKELDWRAFKPWTRDFQHPFASMASPRSGIAHPVRSYEQPRVSVMIHGEDAEALHHTLTSLEAQTSREWEVVSADGKVIRFDPFPYFTDRLPKAHTIIHTLAGEWLYPELVAQVAERGGRWRYEGYKLWQM